MRQRMIILMLAGIFSLCSLNISRADYMVGSKGNDVKYIQQRLNKYGYRVSANGIFDGKTKKAVMQFQKKRKLDADGIVGPATYKALTGKNLKRASVSAKQNKSGLSKGKQKIGIDDSIVQWHYAGPVTKKVKDITEEAKRYVGVPYRFGGTTPKGFDCSGFIQYVFNRKGILLPRSADEQYFSGEKISVNSLKPGDLVFFNTYAEGISHSGLYLGDGYFISATTSRGVAVATMKNGYWHDRYIGANRIL